MLFVRSISNNPFYNLAAEEFFLKNSTEEVFMLWLSGPSVIVGKHQNTLSEINYKYIVDNNITIARRLTGGGTVVHDMHNINFTFIANGEPGKLINFKKFVTPVTDYLKTLGVDARIGDKNDILIGNLKISGNAEHVYKKRVLHHGTLLYNSDLTQLKKAIETNPGRYIDKAVQSNRASVTNIAGYLGSKIATEDFILGLSNFILKNPANSRNYIIKQQENITIQKLVEDKYSTIEWIFGYSPRYIFQNIFEISGSEWIIHLEVERGVIHEARILKDKKELHNFAEDLKGEFHLIEPVSLILKKYSSYFKLFEENLTVFFFF